MNSFVGWKKLNGEKIEKDIITVLESAILIELKAGHQLKVCVGTDSKKIDNEVRYATVIVVLRKGNGGFMFVKKNNGKSTIATKERMLNEVTYSVETAYAIQPLMEKHKIPLEVHADININEQYASNVAYKEAMGYIKGMGYDFKAKPEAFASSSCADRLL